MPGETPMDTYATTYRNLIPKSKTGLIFTEYRNWMKKNWVGTKFGIDFSHYLKFTALVYLAYVLGPEIEDSLDLMSENSFNHFYCLTRPQSHNWPNYLIFSVIKLTPSYFILIKVKNDSRFKKFTTLAKSLLQD